jgi:hypothetical protein
LIAHVIKPVLTVVRLAAPANMFVFLFPSSDNVAALPFHLLHCDVWTSPVLSNSGFKYYLVILDDFSYYTWTIPLRYKSDVYATIVSFHAYVSKQFQMPILNFQNDNGKEFDNAALRSFLTSNGISLRQTCPHTRQQNGRAEQVLRTLNDTVRCLLFHAAIPTSFWPDAPSESSSLPHA